MTTTPYAAAGGPARPDAGPLRDLFGTVAVPVIVAWGVGVDSTAMLIELVERGEAPDVVLFADTGSEKPETYAYLALFTQWLADRGVPVHVVRYVPTRFKNFPAYSSLFENCLSNGTLPSITFGGGSCSLKWKVAPQNKWTAEWEPAQRCWAAGGRVVKMIGYDCSPADNARYAHSKSLAEDERYEYRFPLREWGWTRDDCVARIKKAGLPVPNKSACYFCAASKPHEIAALPPALLRRIVLMEARAQPRLRNVDGLWRKPVKGMRGATPRPGSMTQFIREQALLPADEIDAIIASAPAELVAWREAAFTAPQPAPPLKDWLTFFDTVSTASFQVEGAPDIYPDLICRAA